MRRAGVVAVVAAVCLTTACSGGPGGSPNQPGVDPPRAGSSDAADRPTASEPDWRPQSPRAAGFSPSALRGLAAQAREAGSSCFLVARHGRIVGEWNWLDVAPDTPREVYSVTKSVTSTLVGLAAADGLLNVDASAAQHVPAWRDTPAEAVTVRNLLANDSGREWTTQSDYVGLIGARDRTAYAVGLGQQFAPGDVWAYNNAAIQTLDAVLSDATGMDTATYAQRALFEPLGMTDSRLTDDAAHASTSTAFGLNATCGGAPRTGRDRQRAAGVHLCRGGPGGHRRAARAAGLRRSDGVRCAR